METPSKTSVRKAGSTVRRVSNDGGDPSAELLDALDTIRAYRASFSYPLCKVNNGLRGFLHTLSIDAEVSQRLKRMETIVDKITNRERGLDLTRMNDIGGCRIVLHDNSIDDLRRIQEWIKWRWDGQLDPRRERDYIVNPRESGYRSMHLVAIRDDRPIEIQIRTQRMHERAQLIESLSQVFGENFKQDHGRSTVQEFGRSLSLVHQHLDGMYALTESDDEAFKYWSAELSDMLKQQISGEEGG